MNRTLVIMGSARAAGNTAAAVDRLASALPRPSTRIDLCCLSIRPFAYDRPAEADDFEAVIGQMVRHEQIVFATPVYWYAMSGLMKILFDRFTDLLLTPDGRKMGRALAARQVWVMATGTDATLPRGFHEPFARTADYFDMEWRRAFYVHVRKDVLPVEQDFAPADEQAAALG